MDRPMSAGLSEAERDSIRLSWPHATDGSLACMCLECQGHVMRTVESILAARLAEAEQTAGDVLDVLVARAQHWVEVADKRPDLPQFSSAYTHSGIIRDLAAYARQEQGS